MDFAKIICEVLDNSNPEDGLLLFIKIPAENKKDSKKESINIYDPFETFGSKHYAGGGGSSSSGGSGGDFLQMEVNSPSSPISGLSDA